MIQFLSTITFSQVIMYGVSFIIILFTILEKSGSKYNPWTFMLKAIGKVINGEVIQKMEKFEKDIENNNNKISELRARFDEEKAVSCRIRIARFADEIRLHIKHSKDQFDQTMMDITNYERYCKENSNFANNITISSIMLIKKTYQELLENGGFLV